MLGVSLKNRISNAEIRKRTGVRDAIRKITTLNFNLTGHIAKTLDDR